MNKRTRRRSSPFRIMVLLILIAGAIYLDRIIIPQAPALFVPTPTPTRAPESYVNEAREYFQQGKMLPAIEAYKKAVLTEPNNQAIFTELARVQIWAGNYEDALQNAERSLVGNENYALGHAVRGWALNFLEQYVDAEIALRRALEIDPDNPLSHAYLAETLVNKDDYGDLDKAREESRLAVDLAPNMLETLRARAYVLFVTGNYTESLDHYQRAIALYRYIPDLFLYQGYNYAALMETNPEYIDLAIDSYLQANSLNPANSIPDLELSRLFLRLGEHEKAIQYAENAVKDEPQNAYRYGNLGVMYYEADKFNQAVQALAIAIRGGTTEDGTVIEGIQMDYISARYFWYYGFALAKTVPNQCSEAVPVFQALLSGMPDYQIAVDNATAGLELCAAAPETEPEVETEDSEE